MSGLYGCGKDLKKKKTHIWLKKLDLAVWVYLSLLSQHVKP